MSSFSLYYSMIYLSRFFVELFDSKFEKLFVSLVWLVDETVEGVGKPIKLKKSISSNSIFFRRNNKTNSSNKRKVD